MSTAPGAVARTRGQSIRFATQGGTRKTQGIGARLRAQQKQQSPEVRNSPQWAEGSGSVHVAETPVTQAATVPPAAHRSQSRRLTGPGLHAGGIFPVQWTWCAHCPAVCLQRAQDAALEGGPHSLVTM
uniref:uncharacterized protein LOC129507504 isoform X2 n=1 Tax=Nyctereutes procyonoides TaxID=34880 RepID=UPI002444EAE3|nr:uncharacterized protein LOC129507504 isoform X2 [Nyctereutes procyonoides]